MLNMRNPNTMWSAAQGHLQQGKFIEAKNIFSELIQILPSNPQVLVMAGYCERKLNDFQKALEYFNQALQHDGENIEIIFQIANTYDDLRDYRQAETYYRKTLQINPQMTEAWNSLGGLLRDKNAAVQCYQKAIELAPQLPGPHFNLATITYDENDLVPCMESLTHYITLDSDFLRGVFHLGLVYWRMGETKKSEECRAQISGPGLEYLLDTFDYIKENAIPTTRFFGTTFDTLSFVLENTSPDGMYLEFGVNHGETIRYMAALVETTIHGFDSFEGLPESWEGEPTGIYSTYGNLPPVPSNVVLHKGWFSDTLPGFLEKEKDAVSFVNVDCDLYSSTKAILDLMGERLKTGSILVFDEYFGYDGWRDHEYKAFHEFVTDQNLDYEYIAFGHFSKQAAVQIL